MAPCRTRLARTGPSEDPAGGRSARRPPAADLRDLVEDLGELARAVVHRHVPCVELDRLLAEHVPRRVALPVRADHGVPRADDVRRMLGLPRIGSVRSLMT